MGKRWLALGVVALASVGAIWYFAIRTPAPEMPEGVVPFVLPLFPIGMQEGLPDEIRWRPVEGAASYEVEISGPDKKVIWKTKTEEARVPFPETLRDSFMARDQFYYRIRAKGGLGKTIAKSEPILLRLSLEASRRVAADTTGG